METLEKVRAHVREAQAHGVEVIWGGFNVDYDYQRRRWSARNDKCCPLGCVLVGYAGPQSGFVGEDAAAALDAPTEWIDGFWNGFDAACEGRAILPEVAAFADSDYDGDQYVAGYADGMTLAGEFGEVPNRWTEEARHA